LEPETGVSYEIGAKSQLLDGRLDMDTSVFRMDFRSGLTYAQDVNGQFGRTNGGESRFQGFEIESRFQLAGGWQLRANYANHDSRFVNLTGADGVDVSGNRVEMSPRQLGAFGLLYEAPAGLSGTVVVNYVSPRELDATNTVQAGGYTTLDASLRYSVNRYQFQLNGYNLTDARDPVAASELNQSVTVTGTAGYYRLPSRTVVFSVRHAW
jgi:outer membrane receptor protein involved in Fe transport